jgi:hypothetical protein
MSVHQQNHPEMNKAEVSAPQKEKWSPPVIVPLDVTLTERNPGVGTDSGFFDSSRS